VNQFCSEALAALRDRLAPVTSGSTWRYTQGSQSATAQSSSSTYHRALASSATSASESSFRALAAWGRTVNSVSRNEKSASKAIQGMNAVPAHAHQRGGQCLFMQISHGGSGSACFCSLGERFTQQGVPLHQNRWQKLNSSAWQDQSNPASLGVNLHRC
jgi:hypothetical protein